MRRLNDRLAKLEKTTPIRPTILYFDDGPPVQLDGPGLRRIFDWAASPNPPAPLAKQLELVRRSIRIEEPDGVPSADAAGDHAESEMASIPAAPRCASEVRNRT